jgi:hypothetical protein
MSTFVRFFYEFISIIFNGIKEIFNGIVKGFKIILSPKDYLYLINNYSEEFNGPDLFYTLEGKSVRGAIIFRRNIYDKKTDEECKGI